jgi:5-methylthioadenosine/S-adenosylhomocysteine deaminase
VRTLIRSAHVVSMDRQLGDLPTGDVLVDGDRIVAVAPHLDAPDAEVLDASGTVLLPGFVNPYAHVWQSLLRGIGSDWTRVAQYSEAVLLGAAPRYTPEDAHLATRLAMLDAVDAGVTTTLDWCHLQNSPEHTDAIVAAHRGSGARVVFAYGVPMTDFARWMRESVEPHPRDARRVRTDLADDDALVTMALAPRSTRFATWDVVADGLGLARELGLRSALHVSAPDDGDGFVAALERRGLLADDLQFLQGGVHVESDFALIRDAGATVSIAPESGLQTGGPFPPLARIRAAGLRPGLGAEGLPLHGASPFPLMRLTLQTARALAAVDGAPPSAREVLAMATIDGARTLGLGDRTGSVTPGKQADLVLLDATRPGLFPLHDPAGLVVQSADVGNVDTVMVAGRVLKRGGRLLDVDLAALRRAAEDASARLAGTGPDRPGADG